MLSFNITANVEALAMWRNLKNVSRQNAQLKVQKFIVIAEAKFMTSSPNRR
jgi:hypothetical protein